MMAYFKWAFLGLIVLIATAISSAQQTTAPPAQQKFLLTPGEWIVTAPSTAQGQPPVVLSYCLNDATWMKTLERNHSCRITNYSAMYTGITYNMSCTMNNFQMKGKVTLVFDGMTHMVGQGSFTMDSFKSGVTHSDTQTDYRWKSPTCDPKSDVNLKVGTQSSSEPKPQPVHPNHVDH
ncbi:MAG: DUF3617 domain-containing protein [Terracidiphilus sp.]|jgi:hypothetical protein